MHDFISGFLCLLQHASEIADTDEDQMYYFVADLLADLAHLMLMMWERLHY